MEKTRGGPNKRLAARQIFRFQEHLLRNNTNSEKLALINRVDPGHIYPHHLGWDQQKDAVDEEKWRSTWGYGA